MGLASTYGYPGTGDPLSGKSLRCQRFMSPRAYQKALPIGVAHRTLPCGTKVLIWDLRTGRRARAIVIDSGPYGALLPSGRWVIKRRASDPGVWRGVLDVLPPVAARLGLTGLDPVIVQVRP